MRLWDWSCPSCKIIELGRRPIKFCAYRLEKFAKKRLVNMLARIPLENLVRWSEKILKYCNEVTCVGFVFCFNWLFIALNIFVIECLYKMVLNKSVL